MLFFSAVFVLGGFFTPILVAVLTAQETTLGMSSHGPDVQANQADLADPDIQNRMLLVTRMRTTTAIRTATCATSGCFADAAAFEPATVTQTCNLTTCTIKLTFCGQYFDSSVGDNLMIRYLIDGAPPVPGPTDEEGFVSVDRNAQAQNHAYCFSVVGAGITRGPHTIEVCFGVQDQTGNGASVSLNYAELNIQVYRP